MEKKTDDFSETSPEKLFMVMKFFWPIDSITNALFSIKKGEIIKIPAGFKPDENIFETYETYEQALSFVKKMPVEVKTSNQVTTSEMINSKLRRVSFLQDDGTSKLGFILKDKDIPEELSRNARELIMDINKLDDEETLQKMLEIESRCDKRKAVVDALKAKLK